MILELDWLLGAASDRAGRSTVPILDMQTGVPRQHGTGTLIRIADAYFLVSAGHVFLRSLKANVPLFVAGNGPLIPLDVEGVVYTNEYQRGLGSDDPYDLVVWRLKIGVADRLGRDRFLDQTDLQFDPDLSRGMFFVFGYPREWSGPMPTDAFTITQAAFALIAAPYTGRTSFDRYKPEINVLLSYGGHVQPLGGNDVGPPKSLEGISGCSIWKLHDEHFDETTWTANCAKVIGIQTGVYTASNAIRGTKWLAAMRIIARHWPELTPCLNLEFPRIPVVVDKLPIATRTPRTRGDSGQLLVTQRAGDRPRTCRSRW